jgi:hypothetical protein
MSAQVMLSKLSKKGAEVRGLKILKKLLRLGTKWLIIFETPLLFLIISRPLQDVTIWIVGYGSLLFLAYNERRKVPFPFIVKLSTLNHAAYASLAFVGAWLLTLLLFTSQNTFVSSQYIYIYPSTISVLLTSLNAGITEESFKVTLTNLLAWLPVHKANRRKTRKRIITVAGTVAIAIWAIIHRLVLGYTWTQTLAVGIAGAWFLAIVYWKRNYFPAVFGHVLFDIAVGFHWI